MNAREDESPADTMADRAEKSRLKLYLLMEANRLAVTGGIVLAVFVSFVFTVTVLEPPFVQHLKSGTVIRYIFSSMIGAILTGTTIVVSIGQLVLTQETGPLGDQRERMSNAMDFRDFTKELTGEPSPTDPGEFLRDLVEETINRSIALQNGLGETDSDVEDEIDVFVEKILENAQAASEQLDGTEFGSFDLLSAALNFNYSWKIAKIEQLQSEHATKLTQADVELLEDLKTALSMYGPAREHVKTLYFQWELINLSQLILYAAIPALVIAAIMTAVVGPETAPGTLLGVEQITILVGAAFSLTLLPFLLFVAYILRIVTVAKRTLAIEPLILRER